VSTQNVKGFEGLRQALTRDFAKMRREIVLGAARAGRSTTHEVAKNVPVAFGELRESVHLDASGAEQGVILVVADAPHAVAVEVGSRPHLVPLEPLIAWVRLRGLQASAAKRLTARGNAAALAPGGGARANADGAVTIARAIQFVLLKRGTKPAWFMRQALPYAMRALDTEVATALRRCST